jgi:hypothetical protein
MFKRFGQAALEVIEAGRASCQGSGRKVLGTEHLLLCLAQDEDSLAARALLSMGINTQNITKEMERLFRAEEVKTAQAEQPAQPQTNIGYSECALAAFAHALDHCRYFGLTEVGPEQLLLGVVDVADCGAVKILDELGANMSFLRRHIMFLMARQHSSKQTAPSLRNALVAGLTDLIDNHLDSVRALSSLASRAGSRLHRLPDRREILQMVFLGYMPDLLCTQIAFQRHLLQEAIKLMEQRTGVLEQELSATIVSNSAQHLRLEVRSTIEYLWSNEYRLFDQILNEAEHDLIGSVIEDLWWAHSEEIALHELFDEALVDHRRKQLLTLQKRRLEISQRLEKLKSRLAETIKQCFVKRSISA